MDVKDWLVSQNVLNEQITKEIFDILPESGPIMVVMDRYGRRQVSDPEKFSRLNIRDSFWRELCAKIDDGAEPVTTQTDGCSVAAAELVTEQTKFGYVIIILPQHKSESTLTNIDLIETILNQACLIAGLIENNHHLCELQMKFFSSYAQSETSSN
ncbi:MAG: hypothetical protein WC476_05740 [Phycisphaerae bacterium]|jgi:hypothetical protein